MTSQRFEVYVQGLSFFHGKLRLEHLIKMTSVHQVIASKYPLIVKSDMDENLLTKVIQIAYESLHNSTADSADLATRIKERCDSTLGPVWFVAVGECFGAVVNHEVNHMALFKIGRKSYFVIKSH